MFYINENDGFIKAFTAECLWEDRYYTVEIIDNEGFIFSIKFDDSSTDKVDIDRLRFLFHEIEAEEEHKR